MKLIGTWLPYGQSLPKEGWAYWIECDDQEPVEVARISRQQEPCYPWPKGECGPCDVYFMGKLVRKGAFDQYHAFDALCDLLREEIPELPARLNVSYGMGHGYVFPT